MHFWEWSWPDSHQQLEACPQSRKPATTLHVLMRLACPPALRALTAALITSIMASFIHRYLSSSLFPHSIFAECANTGIACQTRRKGLAEDRLTCEVQTLLKVTNSTVCTNQLRGGSRWRTPPAATTRTAWGRKARAPTRVAYGVLSTR